MAQVISIDDHRPHVTITWVNDAGLLDIHVMPVSLLRAWVDGDLEIDECEEWKPVVRAILGMWLDQNEGAI